MGLWGWDWKWASTLGACEKISISTPQLSSLTALRLNWWTMAAEFVPNACKIVQWAGNCSEPVCVLLAWRMSTEKRCCQWEWHIRTAWTSGQTRQRCSLRFGTLRMAVGGQFLSTNSSTKLKDVRPTESGDWGRIGQTHDDIGQTSIGQNAYGAHRPSSSCEFEASEARWCQNPNSLNMFEPGHDTFGYVFVWVFFVEIFQSAFWPHTLTVFSVKIWGQLSGSLASAAGQVGC